MDAYLRSTKPLTEYYQRAGKLVSISAAGSPEEILERALAQLGVMTA
jgi:adenylate kinase family enzyme